MRSRLENRGVPLALAVLAGVLHGACFAPLGVWPLAFVALAPLIAVSRGRGALTSLALGWVAGTVAATLAVVPWIAAAARDYFQQGALGAVLFALGVGQLFGALHVAAFGALLPRLGRLRAPTVRVLATAAAWTALELLRARAFTGAPWDLLAHALYARPLWIQTADLGGAFLVSFVLAASSAAVAELLVAPFRQAAAALGLAAALLGLSAGYGALRLGSMNDAGGPFVRVALVQGNVPNPWRVDAARAEEAFQAFADATRSIVPLHPDLVVWPENAVSFLLAPNPRFGRATADILGSDGPGLLLGGPRYVADGDGHVRFFNSAYLLDADGEPVMVYDKRHLVPFAEYAPLPRVPWLGWRFDAPGDYTPGVLPTIFPDPAPFGVLICFEAIYPELARDLVRHGARFLLNLSNDAWFGTSAGLEQHLAMTVFRAVETRRGLARATNTGVTALVAPSGRIQARFPTGVRGAWVVEVPLRDGLSPYARAGDLFAWFASLGALVALAAAGGHTVAG